MQQDRRKATETDNEETKKSHRGTENKHDTNERRKITEHAWEKRRLKRGQQQQNKRRDKG